MDGTPSTAAMTAPNAIATAFTVDYEGAYMVRLVTDSGLPTEDTRYLRVQYETKFGSIGLVAGGEKNDGSEQIPADIDTAGWANDENLSLQKLGLFVRRVSTSGRILVVDANRGRSTWDNTQTPDDRTNTFEVPGTDPVDLVATGATVKAQGFGDFSSINLAITYALAAAARGEPAVSATEPYLIYIQPGVYSEDLILHPHVHLIGLGHKTQGQTPTDVPDVIVQAQALGHTLFSAAAGDVYILRGVTLTSNLAGIDTLSIDALAPSLTGSLYLFESVLAQQAVGGGSVLVMGDGTAAITVKTYGTLISDASTAGAAHYAVEINGVTGTTELDRSFVRATSSAMRVNNLALATNYTFNLVDAAISTTTAACVGLHSLASINLFEKSKISVVTAANALLFNGGPKAGTLSATLRNCTVEGNITFDTAACAGATTFRLSDTIYTAVTLPTANPTTSTYESQGKSIRYVPDLTDPWDVHAGLPAVPVAQRLASTNSQDAIDDLVMISTLPNALGGGYSGLDAAYDGLSSLTPPTRGAGLGREIVADQSAVRISGSTHPVSTTPGGTYADTNANLHIERNIKVGVFDTPEIDLDPNLMAAGPVANMGWLVWSAELTPGAGNPRSLPAGIVQGASILDGGLFHNYGLRIQTQSTNQVSYGHVGWPIIRGGDSSFRAGAGPLAAPVIVQGGSYLSDTVHAGSDATGRIWLAPGIDEDTSVAITTPATLKAGQIQGTVRLVMGQNATPASLAATVAAIASTAAGTLYFGTPMGLLTVPVALGDAAADVVITINALGRGLVWASAPAGVITIQTYDRGPAADIYYITASNPVINTDLGDFTLAGGATFQAGTFPTFIDVYCSGTGEVTFGNPAQLQLVYNAVTGKLTVPGVIDPTTLVLEPQAAPGLTLAKGTFYYGTDKKPKCVDEDGIVYDLSNGLNTMLSPPGATLGYQGTTTVGTVGEIVVAGDVLYLNSDGKWWKAFGDAFPSVKAPVAALATVAAIADASITLLRQGYFRLDTWGWTVGGVLFLSPAAAGTMTHTRPIGVGEKIQAVAIAESTLRVYFNPAFLVQTV